MTNHKPLVYRNHFWKTKYLNKAFRMPTFEEINEDEENSKES